MPANMSEKNEIDFLELKYVMLYIYLAELAIYCVW